EGILTHFLLESAFQLGDVCSTFGDEGWADLALRGTLLFNFRQLRLDSALQSLSITRPTQFAQRGGPGNWFPRGFCRQVGPLVRQRSGRRTQHGEQEQATDGKPSGARHGNVSFGAETPTFRSIPAYSPRSVKSTRAPAGLDKLSTPAGQWPLIPRT